MNAILQESHEKGRSSYGLKDAVECIKCHSMTYFVTNTKGITTCLMCAEAVEGGEHDNR